MKFLEGHYNIGIKTMIDYLIVDYYCRAYIRLAAAFLFCALYFELYVITGRDPNFFTMAVFIFCSLVFILISLLLFRLLKMLTMLANGLCVPAAIDDVVLFGTVPYEIEKAKEMIAELSKRDALSIVKVKRVKFHYLINGKRYERIYYLYGKNFNRVSSIITANTSVVVDAKHPNGFFVLPAVLGLDRYAE